MKILLVAPVYLNLYKIIKDELVAEGHSVVYFPEGMLPWNPYYRYPNPIKRWVLRFLFEQRNMGKKYWVDRLNDSLFNQYYDLLFVIQGVTFHPCVTERMRKYNRLLKTVLYIWDSNYSYDFFVMSVILIKSILLISGMFNYSGMQKLVFFLFLV